jgi:hypothetical protein
MFWRNFAKSALRDRGRGVGAPTCAADPGVGVGTVKRWFPKPAADSFRDASLCILEICGQAFRVIALENGYEYELLAGHPLGRSGSVTKLHGPDATLTLEDHVDLLKDWLEDDPLR